MNLKPKKKVHDFHLVQQDILLVWHNFHVSADLSQLVQLLSFTSRMHSLYGNFLSPIRMRQKYTRVNILRCANFTPGKQMAHVNANTHQSVFTYG